MKYLAVLAALAISPAAALSGRATTTRYSLGQSMGACGCGTDGSHPFAWQSKIEDGVYTAAGSPALWRSAGTWCGAGCGSCYKLTSTGASPPGEGTGGLKGQSIIVMLTNLCPHQGNERWCPNTGQKNEFGMEYHFDIQTEPGKEVFGNNLIVDFESVPCPSKAVSDFEQCQCKSSTNPSKPPSGGSGGSGQKAPRFGQCGGKNWHGPKECEAPYHCQEQNIWYSQCL